MNKEQIIRELECCYEYFSNNPYRRRALQEAIQIVKEEADGREHEM